MCHCHIIYFIYNFRFVRFFFVSRSIPYFYYYILFCVTLAPFSIHFRAGRPRILKVLNTLEMLFVRRMALPRKCTIYYVHLLCMYRMIVYTKRKKYSKLIIEAADVCVYCILYANSLSIYILCDTFFVYFLRLWHDRMNKFCLCFLLCVRIVCSMHTLLLAWYYYVCNVRRAIYQQRHHVMEMSKEYNIFLINDENELFM